MSEVIFCIDMFEFSEKSLEGAYAPSCEALNEFNLKAKECGLPVWMVAFDLAGIPGGFIPAGSGEERAALIGKLSEGPKGGFGGMKVTDDMPITLKRASSAFDNENLEKQLKDEGIAKIRLAGFSSNDCLAATAIDAALRGFDVSVVEELAFGGHAVCGEDRRQEILWFIERRFCRQRNIPYAAPYGQSCLAAKEGNTAKIWRTVSAKLLRNEDARAVREMMSHPDYAALSRISTVRAARLLEKPRRHAISENFLPALAAR